MDGLSAQKSLLDEPAHLKHLECELVIMADGDFQTAAFSQSDQRFRFAGRNRERLFQVNIASRLETLSGQREMTLWRCGNVNDLRGSRFQHFL